MGALLLESLNFFRHSCVLACLGDAEMVGQACRHPTQAQIPVGGSLGKDRRAGLEIATQGAQGTQRRQLQKRGHLSQGMKAKVAGS